MVQSSRGQLSMLMSQLEAAQKAHADGNLYCECEGCACVVVCSILTWAAQHAHDSARSCAEGTLVCECACLCACVCACACADAYACACVCSCVCTRAFLRVLGCACMCV